MEYKFKEGDIVFFYHNELHRVIRGKVLDYFSEECYIHLIGKSNHFNIFVRNGNLAKTPSELCKLCDDALHFHKDTICSLKQNLKEQYSIIKQIKRFKARHEKA